MELIVPKLVTDVRFVKDPVINDPQKYLSF